MTIASTSIAVMSARTIWISSRGLFAETTEQFCQPSVAPRRGSSRPTQPLICATQTSAPPRAGEPLPRRQQRPATAARSSAIRAAVSEILDNDDELCSCAAALDEFAYGARSAAEHSEAMRRIRGSFLYLPAARAIDEIIIDIRTALFAAGKGRAAGVIDVQIAATAVHHHATVLHYGADYDHISDAYPELSARWVVPRGTVD